MYYFAYASNLNLKQMSKRCPEATAKFTATLPNHKLIFSGYSRERKGASATLEFSRGDRVIGGIYEIAEASLRKLDKFEGYPTAYKHLNVTVFKDNGDAIQAITYIRAQQAEQDKPSNEYLMVIQQGYKDWGII